MWKYRGEESLNIADDQQETKNIVYSQVLKYLCNNRMNKINYYIMNKNEFEYITGEVGLKS